MNRQKYLVLIAVVLFSCFLFTLLMHRMDHRSRDGVSDLQWERENHKFYDKHYADTKQVGGDGSTGVASSQHDQDDDVQYEPRHIPDDDEMQGDSIIVNGDVDVEEPSTASTSSSASGANGVPVVMPVIPIVPSPTPAFDPMKIDIPEVMQPHIPAALRSSLRRREHSRQIIDTFTFNNEFEMLDVRLRYLWDVVDYFIIAEAPVTFQNTSKPLHFHTHKEKYLEKYRDKLIHVVVESLPTEFKYWENEVHFRDALGKQGVAYYHEQNRDRRDKSNTMHYHDDSIVFHDDDLVLTSDVDEIPNVDVLRFLKQHRGYSDTCIRTAYRWSYYGFYWKNRNPWIQNTAITVRTLREGQWQSNEVRRTCLGRQRQSGAWQIGTMENPVGWHCSWCFPLIKYVDKISSFAHSEMNTAKHKDLKRIRHYAETGKWLLSDKVEGVKSDLFHERWALPSFILKEPEKYYYVMGPDYIKYNDNTD